MKVAVSIPDPIFAEAETLAKRFKTSRSKLYGRALGRVLSHELYHILNQTTNHEQ